MPQSAGSPPHPFVKWGVCGLLLLATMLNYMDRLTLNQTASRIKNQFDIGNPQYADLETGFGFAFAIGAVGSGLIVDRGVVRWFYPLMVFCWSLAGFMTGFARTYDELLICRIALGLFEAANWPCALYTTQRLLAPAQRSMGNGILQSGAALGAIFTPLIIIPFLGETVDDRWRYPFLIIGAVGIAWVALWFALIRRETIPTSAPAGSAVGAASIWEVYTDRRFWVLAFVVVAINLTWHFFRAWMPLMLHEQHGYSERFTAGFTSAYYISTDLGSLTAGALTLYLARRGLSVHKSRMSVFLLCALLTMLAFVAAGLPSGWLLLAVLLVIGFGALGLFPNYYSFTQELSSRHQGKVTGSLGFICWMAMATSKIFEGQLNKDGDYSTGVALAGIPPMLAFFVLLLFWKTPVAPPAKAAASMP